MKFRMIFCVEGAGQFPVDMMRYDHCFPASESDSGVIEEYNVGRRKVTMTAYVRSKAMTPTEGRWSSFGWRVTEIRHEKLP